MSEYLLWLIHDFRLTKSEGPADVWQQKQKDKVASRLATFGCKLVIQKHTSEDTDGDKNT